MSKVKLAPVVDDISGKISNIVFTKGRSGLNIRRRSIPGNPQSAAQLLVRGFFATWAAAFRLLTSVKIIAWNDFVMKTSKSNIFGEKYHLSGSQAYNAANVTNSLYGSGVEVDTPITPVVPSPIGVSAIDADATLGTFTVTTDDAVPANTVLVIRATRQFSAGVSNFKGKAVDIKTFPAGTAAGNLAIFTEYEAKCGTLLKDQKLAVQCYLTNTHATLKVALYKNGAELATKVK